MVKTNFSPASKPVKFNVSCVPPSATVTCTESMPVWLRIVNGDEPNAPSPPAAVSKNTSPMVRPSPLVGVDGQLGQLRAGRAAGEGDLEQVADLVLAVGVLEVDHAHLDRRGRGQQLPRLHLLEAAEVESVLVFGVLRRSRTTSLEEIEQTHSDLRVGFCRAIVLLTLRVEVRPHARA